MCNKSKICNICEGMFKQTRGCNLEKRCPSCRFLGLQRRAYQNGIIYIPDSTKLKEEGPRKTRAENIINYTQYETLEMYADTIDLDNQLFLIEFKEQLIKLLFAVLPRDSIKIILLRFGFMDGYSYSVTEIQRILGFTYDKVTRGMHNGFLRLKRISHPSNRSLILREYKDIIW